MNQPDRVAVIAAQRLRGNSGTALPTPSGRQFPPTGMMPSVLYNTANRINQLFQ